MKSLNRQAYNAYREYKELGQEISRLGKEKQRLKESIESGFGRALVVITPDGIRLEKKLIHQEVPAHIREYYRYMEG